MEQLPEKALDDAVLYLLASRRLAKDFLRSGQEEISMVLAVLDEQEVRDFGDIGQARSDIEQLVALGMSADVKKMADIWSLSRPQ